MLMSNWYMINTFVLYLGTATVLVFVIFKLTYCIEFAKFVYLYFSRFYQYIFVFIISENVVVLVACVIAVASILWVSRSYFDVY